MSRRASSSVRHAVAYVRVSTDEQAAEGVSLDAQADRIRSYCRMREMPILDVVCESAVSAGIPLDERTGGRRVVELIRSRKAGSVVALKLDRLFRDCADCLRTVEHWDKSGIALHLVDLGGQAVDTSSAMGRFFLTVMAGAAELERNQIRERTKLAMRYRAAQGEYNGGNPPFGYRISSDGHSLSEYEPEQFIVRQIQDARARGTSLRGIVATLDRNGVRSRSGKPLSLTQIARLVKTA